MESVHTRNDFFEEVLLGVLLQVDIGDLDDAEAVERRWQVANVEGGVGDLDFVASNLVGVERETGSGDDGSSDEVATGEEGGLSR